MLTFITGISCSCCDAYLHQDFNLTKAELSSCIASLPDDVRSRIDTSPAEFLSLLEAVLEGEQELLAVVDKTRGLAKDFVPEGLEPLNDVTLYVVKKGLVLRKDAHAALEEMAEAAKADGIRIVPGSTYRSYADQEYVYAYWVKAHGQEEADRESAVPGHSQHQLGTTVDFSPIDDSFASLPASPWLAGNAWRFGFTISYPDGYEKLTGYKYEPWHYRYIGKEASTLVEKYFGGIQAYFLSFYRDQGGYFRGKMKR